MKTSALQAMVVGVVSISSTIMVIQLVQPTSGSWIVFREEWRTLLSHFISFFFIYILWYNHTKEMGRISSVKADVVIYNAFWLIFLAIIPFATNWVERYPNGVASEFTFVMVTLICILINNLIIDNLRREYPNVSFSTRANKVERLPIYIGLFIALVNSFIFPFFNIFILFAIILYMVYMIIKNKDKDVSIF